MNNYSHVLKRCKSLLCDNIIYPHQEEWRSSSPTYCTEDCKYEFDSLKHCMGLPKASKVKDVAQVEKIRQPKEVREYFPHKTIDGLYLVIKNNKN